MDLQVNLNSSSETFENDLKTEFEKQNRTQIVFFDAVAGDVASMIFK